MALVPIISQTWDTTSVFNPTRMNNIETNIATVSKATGIEYTNGVSVKDQFDSLPIRMMFNGNGKFYSTSQTSLDTVVNNFDVGYFQFENTGTTTTPTIYANRQYGFGWRNQNGEYAWVVVFSFSGAKFGLRTGASTFSWTTLA